MYQNEEKGFVLTDVLLQLLFLVLFVFILIWLFPTKSFVNKLQDQLAGNHSAQDYSILYNKIFNENLTSMKEAAISYYTTPRLPKNIGDKVSMTLGEMLDKKIVLPFKDKNGDSCNVTASYVEVTKQEEEYQMKVTLNCSGEEEYMIVHLGCYQYCKEEICEKTNDQSAVISTNIGKGYGSGTSVTTGSTTIERPIINNNVTINNNCTTCKPEETPKYYCRYLNGVYYGKDGSVVNEATYKKECETTPEPTYYCKYVNGKYYDKSGNVVNADTYKKECETAQEPSKTLYYEYQTKKLVTTSTTVKMCTYYPVEEETANVYTLGYTGNSVANIERYPFAVKLPAGATNIKIKKIYYGQDNFNLSAWKADKKNDTIYNYEYDDTAKSAKDTITSTKLKKSALSKKHFNEVTVLNTRAIDYYNYVELRIDYHANLNRTAVLNDQNLELYNDSNVGYIYYVPIKFYITYDVVSSIAKTKKCTELSSKEEDQIINRYKETKEEIDYEYGPKEWTMNPNLIGVEYTGKTEWR